MRHPEMTSVPCAIIRAGTSKGIFIKEADLPTDPALRDAVILAIFGSPDLRQIDGLGGADSLTSKLAIIGPSSHPDADIDYTFAQVSITAPLVDYKGNCGNISAGVGPFAIDEGFIRAQSPVTTVRIHLTNSGRILTAEVPVIDGKAAVCGDTAIDGCPGTGARITLDWSDTAGCFTGSLLPTGHPVDTFHVDGVNYEVSLVDCGNPLVFIRAESLGLQGTESSAEIDGNTELMQRIEAIRGHAAVRFGLVNRPEKAATHSPYNPFFSIISAPNTYSTFDGKTVHKKDVDIVSRLLFMLKMHKTHPGTGTVCLGAAARIPGTLVHQLLSPQAQQQPVLRIGHPAGVITVESAAIHEHGTTHITRAGIYRTARRIMDGNVYVRHTVYTSQAPKNASQ